MAIQLEIAWDEFVQSRAQAVLPSQEHAAIEKLGRAWGRHTEEYLQAFMDGAHFEPSPLERSVLRTLGDAARAERLINKLSQARPCSLEQIAEDIEMMERQCQEGLDKHQAQSGKILPL